MRGSHGSSPERERRRRAGGRGLGGKGSRGAPMELPVAASVLSVPALELLCRLCSF
jgi:hypothetical protein